jgi:hypothetical protein
VLLQSLSAKIASMSISELLPNRPAAAMIPDDNNAREIIRYFIDVQKFAKFLGVISSHAQIPKPIFFLRAHYNGKRGLILFTYRKYCIIFHLVSPNRVLCTVKTRSWRYNILLWFTDACIKNWR